MLTTIFRGIVSSTVCLFLLYVGHSETRRRKLGCCGKSVVTVSAVALSSMSAPSRACTWAVSGVYPGLLLTPHAPCPPGLRTYPESPRPWSFHSWLCFGTPPPLTLSPPCCCQSQPPKDQIQGTCFMLVSPGRGAWAWTLSVC